MKFRKAFLIEPYKFEIQEVEEDSNDDQVMVKVATCGLCNWEINFWQGTLNFYDYPHPLGHEYAGTIVKVGKNVEGFKTGDRVSCFARGFGGFAEYKVIGPESLRKVNADIDLRYTLGEPQKCVVTALRCASPESGDYGIVLGCGPMGLWCTMGLKGNLLAGLIAVDISDEKLAMAQKYGATHTINSAKENVVERIKEITKGHMADFVIEGTGIPTLLEQAQDYVKVGKGRLILMSSHEKPAGQFDFRKAIAKSLDIIVAHPDHSENENDDFRRAIELVNNGTFKVKELISHEFAFENLNEAFEMLCHKPKDFIKGMVVIDDTQR